MTAFITGCAYALMPYVPPFERTYRLKVVDPETFSIRVKGETTEQFRVASNGDVHIKVPESPRACDHYLFGKINLGGSGWPHIYLIKGNQRIRELSPIDLFEKKPNKEGVYELNLE